MTSPIILHVDMDAFFASIEQLDCPALRGQCVVVGGSHRGVVAAASYEARKYGIHSAMPIFQAKSRCPHLKIVPPRRRRYAELSSQIMALLRSFSPLVEPISIDEAFVDFTGCRRLHGSPQETAMAVKRRIMAQTQLTCSVGMAPNKFLAKIASDLNKPDGFAIIAPEAVPAFIETLPIQKVPGVGARTRKLLMDMGIVYLGQVRHMSEERLVRRLGIFGHRLMALANGQDDSPVTPDSEAKSVSSEITLNQDTVDKRVLTVHLLAQADAVARQLRQHCVRARTLTLKLRTADFQRHTRSCTLQTPTQSSDAIYEAAASLLSAFELNQAVRLVGIGASGLLPQSVPVQQSLFPEGTVPHLRWERLDRTLDAITERYGRDAILRGTLTKNIKKGT
jgi:DNA polymerase IV